MDPQAAALRCGRRPCLRCGVPARGCRPGRLPAAAPPGQFSRARKARLDPGRDFAAAGTLVLAGAAGLARASDPAASRAAPALTGAAGAGLIASAVFATDPVSGYPPGTPDALTHPTRTGIAHNLAAVPVFAGLPAAALASSWRSWRAGQHRFGLYSAGTAITMLATAALAGAGFGQSPRLVNLGGLFQRAAIITGFAWLTTLSAQALRRTPTTTAPRHQAA